MLENIKNENIATNTLKGERFEKENDLPKEIRKHIMYPHVIFNNFEFKKILDISKLISLSSGHEVIPKAIAFRAENGFLNLYLTDKIIYFSKRIKLLNKDNILSDFIVVNLPIINFLYKVCLNDYITIFKQDEKYYLEVQGGVLELETLRIDKSVFEDDNRYKKIAGVNYFEFLKPIIKYLPLVRRGENKHKSHIFYRDNRAIIGSSKAMIIYKSELPYPTINLRPIDTRILAKILEGKEYSEIIVLESNSRILIEGNDFGYSIMKTELEVPELLEDTDFIDLSVPIQLIESRYLKVQGFLANNIEYMNPTLKYCNYDNSSIICLIESCLGGEIREYEFIKSKKSTAELLVNFVLIPSVELCKIMGVFKNNSKLEMSIGKKGLVIKEGNFTCYVLKI